LADLSRDDVLLVGPKGCAARFQNGAWSTTPTGAAKYDLVGLWASGPDEAWAVGGDADGAPIAARWDGREWRLFQAGKRALSDVFSAGGSSSDVWAVGREGTILRFKR
jgi:hypothetical protein